MRDPKRTPVLLDKIAALWQSTPDLRLCQLLSNAMTSSNLCGAIPDMYYIEDNVLLTALKRYGGNASLQTNIQGALIKN